jgi:hypothetical protein
VRPPEEEDGWPGRRSAGRRDGRPSRVEHRQPPFDEAQIGLRPRGLAGHGVDLPDCRAHVRVPRAAGDVDERFSRFGGRRQDGSQLALGRRDSREDALRRPGGGDFTHEAVLGRRGVSVDRLQTASRRPQAVLHTRGLPRLRGQRHARPDEAPLDRGEAGGDRLQARRRDLE